MSWEFAKGNTNQSTKIAEDLDIRPGTVVDYRKIYRDILVQYNLSNTVSLGEEIVMDETMIAGFKKKKKGRDHGPATWSFIIANKEAGNRQIRAYNTQVRNGPTLAPFFLDATQATSEQIKSLVNTVFLFLLF